MTASTVDCIGDRWLASAPVYRTDLHRCTPAETLSTEPELRRWRAIDYATEALSGTLLMAGPETAAPTTTYPLDVSGWHAISIGLMPARVGTGARPTELLLRLSNDPVDSMGTLWHADEDMGLPERGKYLVELFWKITDCTDQDLHIGQVAARVGSGDDAGTFECSPVRVAYIKLVPLTADEVERFQADRDRQDTKRLFAHNDAHLPHWAWRITTADEVRREIEPYRDTDVSRIYWEAGQGDLTNYFSQIGRPASLDSVKDFGRRGDRLHAESWRVLRAKGIDPLDVALEHTHALGVEFHAAIRTAGFHYDAPYDHFNAGDQLYARHPEWRGEDRAGNRTPRMAYTYPGVRAHAIGLLREMAERPIDGVYLIYARRPPLVEYEPPLVQGFKAEFGKDPRELDERDPEWLAYRCGILTQFMREVREAMDDATRRHGRSKRLQVTADCMSSEAENLYFGMDVETWVNEGLVDVLMPYTSVPRLDSRAHSWTDPSDLDFFVDIVHDTDVILAPGVLPRFMSPEEFRRAAARIYGAGVDHLFFWDCAGPAFRTNLRPMWSALKRLGHRDEIQAWVEAGEPALSSDIVPLSRLGDWDTVYETPG